MPRDIRELLFGCMEMVFTLEHIWNCTQLSSFFCSSSAMGELLAYVLQQTFFAQYHMVNFST